MTIRTFLLFCSSFPLIWTPLSERADPRFRFVRNGSAGFIDAKGNVVVEPSLPVTDDVWVDGKLRRSLDPFREGLQPASGPYQMWGYRDPLGVWAIPPQFADALPFQDGLARVVFDGPCATLGDPETPCGWYNLSIKLENRYVRDPLPSCEWQFIDKSGRVAVPGRFHLARSFQNGLAAVQVAPQRWGYIDRQGAMVIEPRFSDAHSFSDGLALVKERERAGFIDSSGRFRIDVAGIHHAKPFSHGRAAIGDYDSGYIYVDTEGKQAIEERFAIASPFFHGLAHVKRMDGSFAYIDPDGRVVFSYRP